MQFPLHARPSDEIGRLAVVSLTSGVEDPDYPIENVSLLTPDEIFLTSSESGAVDVLFDHGVATDIKMVTLHQHNIPAGTNVRVQRNATNVWTAPTMDGALPIVTYPQVGLPFPTAVDLTGVTGYSAGGFRFTRVHIPPLAQLVGLGSLLLWAAKRAAWDPVLPPNVMQEQQAANTFRTTLGRLRGYRKGVRLRATPFRTRQEDAGWAEFITLFRECSSVTPFLWWPDPTHSSDARLVAFGADTILEERLVEGTDLTVSDCSGIFIEQAAGVAIPTTAAVMT